MTAEDGLNYRPPDWQAWEEALLAPYAMRTRYSRGRKFPEPDHPFRSPYQRDRDRIVHSTAFRRLMHKTQVLVTETNDHHRTRLTHTLEVAQISRTVARQLGLNEDLTEAIALAHDVGHPPFGHAGEDALAECMKDHGGFEHNRHGLRILELLEYRYADFPGLNLSWEVRQAQAMHSKCSDAEDIVPYLQDGQPFPEAQVVDAADRLAYNAHDVDDALSVGLITPQDLTEVPFWNEAVELAYQHHPNLAELQFQPTVVRILIDLQVSDLLSFAQQQLQSKGIGNLQDVRTAGEVIIRSGPEMEAKKSGLETFLMERVYHHTRVLRMTNKGSRIVNQLFEEFCRKPELLPDRYRHRAEQTGVIRTVCDYIAGMTDRYAQDEYLKLFQPYTPV